VDRAGEQRVLDEAWRTRTGPLWAVVEGPPGIGKTALATEWGHARASWWPDGALYADLTTTDPDAVLAGWLTALGVHHIPHGAEELRALWRTATSSRRLLAIADNATCVAAAADLLPAGTDCAGIATGHALTPLVAHGARALSLAPLPADETRHLITHLLPHPPQPPVLDAAVDTSRGHPLTAVLTAVALARHPSTTPDQLTTGTETALDTRIATILTTLPPHTERAARLLAVHPGPHITPDLAGTLLDMAPDNARGVLRDLVDAALLTDLGQDRWTHHQLTAAALDRGLDTQVREQAVDAIGVFYRTRVAAAGQIINPWQWRVDEEGAELAAELQHGGDPWFTDRAAALAWLDAEQDNIRAVAGLCARTGRRDTVWQIADHLRTYTTLRTPWGMTHQLYPAALECAQRAGNPTATALMHQVLARVCDDQEQARDHAEAALALYRQAGHAPGVASAHESLATAHLRGGDLDQAAAMFERSVELHLRLDPPRHRGAALQTRKLAEVRIWQDRPAEALAALRRARGLLLTLDTPDRYQAMRCLQVEVQANRVLGDLDEAAHVAHIALAEARGTGSVREEAALRVSLADIAHARDDHGEEVDHLTHALRLLEPTGHPDGEQVRSRLAALRASSGQ
jgi:tetratricopeptide (TPR) repeat protein